MQNITIKTASQSDLPAILELYSQSEMDGDKVISLEQAEALFARMANYPNYKIYIAVNEAGDEGNNVVGVFALLIMDNFSHHGSPSAIVEGVCVAEHQQGQGIGRAMMDKARELCRQAGCYKLSLSSNRRRESAHRFYLSLGFKQHGFSFYTDL